MKTYKEIIPLSLHDVFIVNNSEKVGFDYPIHSHQAHELTLILRSSGNRIVGDSIEKYKDRDLVLIGSGVYHKWDDENVPIHKKNNAHVITVQFSNDFLSNSLFKKKSFSTIKRLLKDSRKGIKFTGETFEIISKKLLNLVSIDGFYSVIEFMETLHILSVSKDKFCLASEDFVPLSEGESKNKINIVYSYILDHFNNPNLRITELAYRFNMSPSAFGHFFKAKTNMSFTQSLVSIRLSYASNLLLNSNLTISEIAYKAGFNNISNFNRLFKKNKTITPKQYREKLFLTTDFDINKQLTPNQFVPWLPLMNRFKE